MAQYPRVEVDPVAVGSLAAHVGATTGVHGIADTSRLITQDNIGTYAPAVDTSTLVKKSPVRAADSTITAQADVVALTVQGAVGQSSDLQQWQNSTGTAVASISNIGEFILGGKSVVEAAGGIGFGNGVASRDTVLRRTSAGTAVFQGINGATSTVLVVKGVAAQSPDLFQAQDSAGAVKMRVWNDGGVGAPYYNGGSGGARMWMTGGPTAESVRVIPTADTQIPLAIRANSATQSADLQQWQDSTAVVLTKIAASGALDAKANVGVGIYARAIDGSDIQQWFSGGAGTALRANLDQFGTFNAARGVFTPINGANVSITAKPNAGGQTGDLIQALNTSGAVIFRVTSGGNVMGSNVASFASLTSINNVGPYLNMQDTQSVFTFRTTTDKLVVKAFAGQSSNIQEWQDSTSAPKTYVTSAGYLGSVRANIGSGGPSTQITLGVQANAATETVMLVRGAASQGASFQEWQDSTQVVRALVSSNGSFAAGGRLSIGQTSVNGSYTASVLSLSLSTPVLMVRGAGSQSGDLFVAQDNSPAALWSITAQGRPRWVSPGLTQTTVGATGAAAALPATPTKYLQVVDDIGTTLVVPAYAAA